MLHAVLVGVAFGLVGWILVVFFFMCGVFFPFNKTPRLYQVFWQVSQVSGFLNDVHTDQ